MIAADAIGAGAIGFVLGFLAALGMVVIAYTLIAKDQRR